MYQHPRMSMMGQSHIGSAHGSIPINVPMGIPASQVMGTPGVTILGDHASFTHKEDHSRIQEQQHYNQLPLRKEVDDEGRICSVVLPETPAPLPTEENNEDLKVKTESEEIEDFMDAAHDTFLKVSSKEMTIKTAADKLGQPYSYVYTRYQEFCDRITGKIEDEPVKKKRATNKGKKLGKRKPKRLTLTKSSGRRSGKRFRCEDCPAVFHSEYLLKSHTKVHLEENESHTCTACGVVFPKLIKLMRHRIEAHQEALQCPHCDSQFTIIASYQYHVRTHTGMKPFVCNECGKGFLTKSALRLHNRLHTGERPYMCGYCEKTFITLGHLKMHQHVHTGGQDKPFECEHCGKGYQFQSTLMDHMNTHTGAMPYGCDLCDQRFNFKANLRVHKMKHTGERPYKCDICPAAYYLPKDLHNHKISHAGMKPFKCELCDYACTRKSTLVLHKYTHTGETPFKCDFYGCNAEFPKPRSLRKHKLQHGPPPPKTCKICHEKFTEISALKRHMMLHTGEKPHTCEQCFKTFIDESSLKRHMYMHMNKPFGQKKARASKKNPAVKKVDTVVPQAVVPIHKKWPPTEYQVPVVAENGHSSIVQQTWTINAEETNSQPPFHPFTATQYSNLVNNAWPSTMDPDELRRRLLNSFK